MSLRLVPVDWRTACGFVVDWHRHHRKPVGYKWAHGVATDLDVLVGVAIVGRPNARGTQDEWKFLDEPLTLEVTRTVTDGHKNANSMLYGACARAAFAKGYRRLVTYTQEGESGSSLRAAGWRVVAELPPRKGWNTTSRPREDRGVDGVARTLWESVA